MDEPLVPPLVPPSLLPRTPPREGEVAALSDLSADARRSSASFHALKRGRDVEEGDESSESLHGGPTMKRSGSLRDLGMANHMSGVPMTKSGLSGCLDDMGLSGLGDSPHVHARKASQVHDLATVPGSPASRPTGEDLLIMPKIDSVLSLPSASPSHADRATRTLSEESMVEVTTPTPHLDPNPDASPDPDPNPDPNLKPNPNPASYPKPDPNPDPNPGPNPNQGEKPRSVNDDDSRELLAVQRTALECSLAKYGLSLAPCTTFDSAPEALEAPTSPRLDASRALRAKLTPEGSRRVEVRPGTQRPLKASAP